MSLNDLARYYELRMKQAMRMDWTMDLQRHYGWTKVTMATLFECVLYMYEADELGDKLGIGCVVLSHDASDLHRLSRGVV